VAISHVHERDKLKKIVWSWPVKRVLADVFEPQDSLFIDYIDRRDVLFRVFMLTSWFKHGILPNYFLFLQKSAMAVSVSIFVMA